MTTGRRILSNMGALTLARGATAVMAFVTMVHLARVLEPAAFGMLMWALAYVAYFHLIPDLGLAVWGTREVARAPARVPELANLVLALRVPMAILTLGLFLGGVLLLDKPPLFKLVIAIQGGALLGAAISLEFVYQGIERMGILAVRNVIVAALTLGGVLTLVRTPDDVVLASGVLVMSLLVGNGWVFLTYRRDFGSIRLWRDRLPWRPVISQSLPIALSLVLVTINLNVDQLLLGLLRSPAEVGLYGAAYRILLAATIPAQIVVIAFLPTLSNSFGDRHSMSAQGHTLARVLFGLGLPIGVAGILLAPDLIAIFGSQYAAASTAFAILMVQGGLYYVNQLYGQALIAWNEQRRLLAALGAGAIVNVILNLLLIPRYGIEGAAIATVLAEIAIIGTLLIIFHGLSLRIYSRDLVRSLLFALVAIGGPGLLRLHFDLPLLVSIILMALSFIVLAPIFGIVSRDELRTLLSSLRRQAS
jgi:O-antigen/teichoic acid export membrane protein